MNDAERLLRAQRPNRQNMNDLLELLMKTRDVRRQWVQDSKPTITEFLNRYPRFVDIPEAVSYMSCLCLCYFREYEFTQWLILIPKCRKYKQQLVILKMFWDLTCIKCNCVHIWTWNLPCNFAS